MANRNLQPVQAMDRRTVTLYGRVVFGGSGAVASVDALGFTVTKPAGTGLYRVTTEDSWPDMIDCQLTIYNGGTPADVDVQRTSNYDPTTKQVDFSTIAAGAAANATSGHAVDIKLTFRNTTTPRKGL